VISKRSPISLPNEKSPVGSNASLLCDQTRKIVEPGIYSHRATRFERNSLTLKSGSPHE